MPNAIQQDALCNLLRQRFNEITAEVLGAGGSLNDIERIRDRYCELGGNLGGPQPKDIEELLPAARREILGESEKLTLIQIEILTEMLSRRCTDTNKAEPMAAILESIGSSGAKTSYQQLVARGFIETKRSLGAWLTLRGINAVKAP